jgi:hypothetical protein
MPFSKATGDLPKIIANQERLYEGSLTFYFRTLFYKSSNIYNPYHNFRHMLHVLWPMSPGMPLLSKPAHSAPDAKPAYRGAIP